MLSVNNNTHKTHKPGFKNQSEDTHLNSCKGNTLKIIQIRKITRKTVPSQGSKLNETINSTKPKRSTSKMGLGA